MRRNANPLHNPRRVYAKILNAGRDGITTTDLCKEVGIRSNKIDQVLASVDCQGYITCEDEGRIYALELLTEPELPYNREYPYNKWRYR